ncbi:MAG: OsmC family protein [Candidatus Helarchaeota archaeon]
MSNEFKSVVKVEMVKGKEGKIFKCNMGLKSLGEIYIDDENEDINEMLGPDPSRLLASAIAGCLAASYKFCMEKKKMQYGSFTVEAEYISAENEKGLIRVKEINVKVKPFSSDEKIKRRIKQCSKIFERTCTVTQSVRAGIKVNVDIDLDF